MLRELKVTSTRVDDLVRGDAEVPVARRTAPDRGAQSSGRPPASAGAWPRRRILACLDRSARSEVCVPYAVSLAGTFGGTITLAHVMNSHTEPFFARRHDALSWEIARQEALGYLERLAREASRSLGRPVDVRLEQGHPAERIVGLAREIGADLTVLGSRGQGGITSWTLGTTVQQVLVIARGSVFIAQFEPMARTSVTPEHIFVPLDGSARSESVLPAATHISSVTGAGISLVHVVQAPLTTAVLDADEDVTLANLLTERLERAARRYLGRLRERLAREGTFVDTIVTRHANERQGLLEASQRALADLIVLSAHGAACDPTRPFGGVTSYLLTHSLVPLLVLQDLAATELHGSQRVDAVHAPPLRGPRFVAEDA